MIPFDFIYLRPDTLAEAVAAFASLTGEGRSPQYYAGGSEVITLCRASGIRPGAVIDLKAIPECRMLEQDGDSLTIGAACTLNQIKISKTFPILGLTAGRIADHTNQCRITLGGNLCGTILYREAVLPLLLADARVSLCGPEGERTLPLAAVFDGRMQLGPGELLAQVHIPAWALTAGYAHIKKTSGEKIDYPLVSVAGLVGDDFLRVAFSGVCDRPFRSAPMEAALNNKAVSRADRARETAALLPYPARSDVGGSDQYRIFVLENTLQELLEAWENGEI